MLSKIKKKLLKVYSTLTLCAVNIVLLALSIFNVSSFLVLLFYEEGYDPHEFTIFVLQITYILINLAWLMTQYFTDSRKIDLYSKSKLAKSQAREQQRTFDSPKKALLAVLLRELRNEQNLFFDSRKKSSAKRIALKEDPISNEIFDDRSHHSPSL